MINIVEGRNLILDINDYEVVLVPASINNSLNSGFKYEVGLNFPSVKEEERKTPYGDMRKYGTVNPIECDGKTFCICYMYVTPHGKLKSTDTVRYDDLCQCLKHIAHNYCGKKICSVLMGADECDGSGNGKRIMGIYNDVFKNTDITLYTGKQRDYEHDIFVEIAILHNKLKDKELTPSEYLDFRSEVEWRRRYGIFKKMPEDYRYIPKKGEVKKK